MGVPGASALMRRAALSPSTPQTPPWEEDRVWRVSSRRGSQMPGAKRPTEPPDPAQGHSHPCLYPTLHRMTRGWVCPISPKAEMPQGVLDSSRRASWCPPSGCHGEVVVGAVQERTQAA